MVNKRLITLFILFLAGVRQGVSVATATTLYVTCPVQNTRAMKEWILFGWYDVVVLLKRSEFVTL